MEYDLPGGTTVRTAVALHSFSQRSTADGAEGSAAEQSLTPGL